MVNYLELRKCHRFSLLFGYWVTGANIKNAPNKGSKVHKNCAIKNLITCYVHLTLKFILASAGCRGVGKWYVSILTKNLKTSNKIL